MLKQKSILFTLLFFCLFSACRKDDIKVVKDLEGTWIINEITHFTDDSMMAIDTTFIEPIGEISFEFCNFHKEDTPCTANITFEDEEVYGILYTTNDYLIDENEVWGIEANINPDANENVSTLLNERPLSNGTWYIEELTDDSLFFTFEKNFPGSARVKCTKK